MLYNARFDTVLEVTTEGPWSCHFPRSSVLDDSRRAFLTVAIRLADIVIGRNHSRHIGQVSEMLVMRQVGRQCRLLLLAAGLGRQIAEVV